MEGQWRESEKNLFTVSVVKGILKGYYTERLKRRTLIYHVLCLGNDIGPVTPNASAWKGRLW